MTLEEKALLSNYEKLTPIDNEKSVWLVKDVRDSSIYIRKEIRCESSEIYRRLQKADIKGVPHIYAVVEDEDRLIVVEEYIHGETVDRYFGKNPPDEEAIRQFGTAICGILSELHSLNPPIICRDIKPSNIMVMGGEFYLTDFNIARSFNSEAREDTHLLGTAAYASPEQYGFGQTDARSDIYSLGVTMNVLLTGCFPKDRIAGGDIGSIIRKATSMDPKDRYASAGHMAKALSKKSTSYPIEHETVTARERLRRPTTIIAIVAYLLWAVFLISSSSFVLVEGQEANLFQKIISGLIFFLLAFLPYLYNGNYFHLLDRTLERYKFNKTKYRIMRVLWTILISVGIPLALAMIFI